MKKTNEHLKILLSPAFGITLCLLLANDFFLKSAFHNCFTGKISDFAGLFVFPLFLFALLGRYKKTIYVITAISFCIWKSPYSQPLIDIWNEFSGVPMSRVVDATDLIALLALPVSFRSSVLSHRFSASRFPVFVMVALSVFAFAATSRARTEIPFSNDYQFAASQIELMRRIYHLSDLDRAYRVNCKRDKFGECNFEVEIPSGYYSSGVDASIWVSEKEGKGIVRLLKMDYRGSKGNDDQKRLLEIFEKDFIEKIRAINLGNQDIKETPNVINPSKRVSLLKANPSYLIPIGELQDVDLDALAHALNSKYRLSVKILPAVPLTDELRGEFTRPQAEKLIDAMRSQRPSDDSHTYSAIIGITETMISSTGRTLEQSFQSDHVAVIALEDLNPTAFCEPANKTLLESRLQKMIARIIGNIYNVTSAEDPLSVWNGPAKCVHDLDRLGTDF